MCECGKCGVNSTNEGPPLPRYYPSGNTPPPSPLPLRAQSTLSTVSTKHGGSGGSAGWLESGRDREGENEGAEEEKTLNLKICVVKW